jgi:hypothetical protein
MKVLALALTTLFSTPTFATTDEQVRQWIEATRRYANDAGICEDYLTTDASHYAESTLFGGEEDPAQISLKPEPGSIEDKFPGTVRRLMNINNRLFGEIPARELWTREVADEVFERRITDIELVCNSVPDPRLCALKDSLAEHLRYWLPHTRPTLSRPNINEETVRTRAAMWEMIMACFFAGEEIHLNALPSKLFPEQFAQLSSDRERYGLDREIDIAVKNADGTWRWIEVKAWSARFNADPNYARSTIKQSIAHDRLREKIKVNAQLILLAKHGFPGIIFLHYKLASKFDQILFAFPMGN